MEGKFEESVSAIVVSRTTPGLQSTKKKGAAGKRAGMHAPFGP